MQTLVRRVGRITSLAPSADGRLFFIEDGQRIGETSSDGRQVRVVVAMSGDRQLSQIHLDSRFVESGFVYVGETAYHPDGSRDFRIVRYRLGDAPERTVLVAVPLPVQAAHAVFAVGTSGHLYVAVPGSESDRQTIESAGMLLRYNADGTVPDEQHGDPVFATGYVQPTAVSFDDRASRLWVAGVDDRAQPSVSSLGESTSSLSLPASSLAAASGEDDSRYLLVVSDAGGLGRALVGPGGVLTTTGNLTIGTGLFRSVAASPDGDVFVVVEQTSVQGTTSSVLRLASPR
jgi:hypothetical protein